MIKVAFFSFLTFPPFNLPSSDISLHSRFFPISLSHFFFSTHFSFTLLTFPSSLISPLTFSSSNSFLTPLLSPLSPLPNPSFLLSPTTCFYFYSFCPSLFLPLTLPCPQSSLLSLLPPHTLPSPLFAFYMV